jgi:ATP-dependent Lhr-like helicase
MAFPAELAWAHPVVAEWFVTRFGTPTEPQLHGWPAILEALISAPTGSGKTLAAFLVCIDQLLRKAIEGCSDADNTCRLCLAAEGALERRAEEPRRAAARDSAAGDGARLSFPEIRTGVRTGDTLQRERAAMLRNPPHILVTTPESLYILLTAAKSREHLRRVRTVIVDEIHAVADDKRGAHLALSLERLDALVCGENRLSPGAFITG